MTRTKGVQTAFAGLAARGLLSKEQADAVTRFLEAHHRMTVAIDAPVGARTNWRVEKLDPEARAIRSGDERDYKKLLIDVGRAIDLDADDKHAHRLGLEAVAPLLAIDLVGGDGIPSSIVAAVVKSANLLLDAQDQSRISARMLHVNDLVQLGYGSRALIFQKIAHGLFPKGHLLGPRTRVWSPAELVGIEKARPAGRPRKVA